MADCSAEVTLFPLSPKPVVVRNDGGALSSDAGVVLLREVDERAGVSERLAVGRAPREADLASQPTLSRLENGAGWRECWRISEALLACFLERLLAGVWTCPGIAIEDWPARAIAREPRGGR